MSRIELREFTSTDLPAAGALLAQRHRAHRLAQPLLSPRYESAEAATAEVRAAFETADASGAVALHAGEPVGYLLGAPKPAPAWGPNIWVEAAGQAIEGAFGDAEVMRDLYGRAAARWTADERTAHYVLTPANDPELLRAWWRLGFGQQHAHGTRDVVLPDTALPETARASDVTVRRAERRDIPALARLDLVLPQHQQEAPVFSARTVPSLDEALAEWADDIDSPDYATFVAELDGTVIGSAVGCALEKSAAHSGPARPDNAGFLGFAAVAPQHRGLGAGRALGEAVLAWAAGAGFSCAVTDWRVTNLLSSRAWPALGFAESFLRLHRHLGY